MRLTTGAALLASLLLAPARSAAAQDTLPPDEPAGHPHLSLILPEHPGEEPPVVRASGLFRDSVFPGALRDGFSVRLNYHLELWRSGTLFDHLEREQTWLALVQLDPLNGRYTLTQPGGVVTHFGTLDSLAAAVSVPYRVELPLPGRHDDARFYYVATLDVESLSLSELEEVESWLRGDLGHELAHEGDVGGALGRGARRLLLRLSGLPSRRLEARSPVFRP